MGEPKIKIREATIDDLNILKSFEQAIIQYEREFTSNLKEDPISYYDLESLIEDENVHVLVASIDDVVVASGYALIKESSPYKIPEKYAYLGFMYVVPAYRGKGINGAIVDKLIAWAKSRKLTEIQLDVYAENEIAINAYSKRGFKANLLNMRFGTE